MGKGKTAQRAARLAARSKPTGPEYVTVLQYEHVRRASGALGLRKRFVKYLKEDWKAKWEKS